MNSSVTKIGLYQAPSSSAIFASISAVSINSATIDALVDRLFLLEGLAGLNIIDADTLLNNIIDGNTATNIIDGKILI